VAVKARLPAMDGSQGTTQPYFETPDGQPLRFTMGDTTHLVEQHSIACEVPTEGGRSQPQQQTRCSC
jgi:hypothetical protein